MCGVHGMKQRRQVWDRKNEREEFCVKLVWSCRDNREECVRQFFGVNEEGRGKRVAQEIEKHKNYISLDE